MNPSDLREGQRFTPDRYPPGYPHSEWVVCRVASDYGGDIWILPVWDFSVHKTCPNGFDETNPGESWLRFHSWWYGRIHGALTTFPAEGRTQEYPATAWIRSVAPPITLTDSQEELATFLEQPCPLDATGAATHAKDA